MFAGKVQQKPLALKGVFYWGLTVRFDDVVGKVVAVLDLPGGCEIFQEIGDGEVNAKGDFFVDLFCFPEPAFITAGIGIEDEGFVAEYS